MGQLVRGLFHKHKDLSSGPQHLHKESRGEAEKEEPSTDWPGNQTESISFRFRERSSLQIKVGEQQRKLPGIDF